MDERREKEARELAGEVCAQIVNAREVARKVLPNALSCGLREGTADYETFIKAYEKERIRLDRKALVD